MNLIVTVIRFAVGALVALVLVASIALCGFTAPWFTLALPVTLGTLAAIFGDQLIVGLLRVFRLLAP